MDPNASDSSPTSVNVPMDLVHLQSHPAIVAERHAAPRQIRGDDRRAATRNIELAVIAHAAEAPYRANDLGDAGPVEVPVMPLRRPAFPITVHNLPPWRFAACPRA